MQAAWQVLFLILTVPAVGSAMTRFELSATAEGEGFVVKLPQNATLTHTPTQIDFEVYQVKVEDRNLVGIYVGNHPSFATDGNPNPASRKLDGKVEYAWQTRCRWPNRLHVFVYGAVVSEDIDLANAIAASVRPGKCPSE